MCLSVPAKIIKVEGDSGQASIGGSIVQVGLQLIDDAKVGDYVLVHTGFALEKISEEEAQETIKLIKQLEDPDNMELS